MKNCKFAIVNKCGMQYDIRSIEDGTISYLLKFEDCSDTVKRKLKQNRINTETVAAFQYPFYECKGYQIITHQNHVHINLDDKYAHIKRFCVDIATGCKDIWIYSYDPVVYLGVAIDSIYVEE